MTRERKYELDHIIDDIEKLKEKICSRHRAIWRMSEAEEDQRDGLPEEMITSIEYEEMHTIVYFLDEADRHLSEAEDEIEKALRELYTITREHCYDCML